MPHTSCYPRPVADCTDDFGPFEGKTWINCSHQGALPRVAVEAAEEAIRWERAPYELTSERFREMPAKLRAAREWLRLPLG